MNGSGRKRTGAATSLGLAFALLGHPALAQAQDAFPLPRTTFGYIGMVEMPSARMAPDGEIDLSTSFFRNTQRYNLGFQALPWLDFDFRYTIFHHLPLDPSIHQYYDRSFGLKIRLFREEKYSPAVSIGFRDIAGTGIYSSEYIVATKRLFSTLDASLGIGWGRLATASPFPNPLGYLAKWFRVRRNNVGYGGNVSFGTFFHGANAGLFGGLVWKTPINNLSFSLEYSSDRYNLESTYGSFTPKYQLNFGVQYRISDAVQVGAEWLYGESAGVTLTFSGNPKSTSFSSTLAPHPIQPSIRTSEQQLQALKDLMRPLTEQSQARRLKDLYKQANISAFAKDIYNSSDDVTNISVSGTTLMVSMDGPAAMRTCHRYAQTAATNLTGIQTVAVRSRNGVVLQCTHHPHGVGFQDNGAHVDIAVVSVTGEAQMHVEPSSHANKFSARAIRIDAAQQLLFVDTVRIRNGIETVYYENGAYQSATEAAGRLIRVLMKDAPPNVEEFDMISMIDGVPAREYKILRSPMERALEQQEIGIGAQGAVVVRQPPMHSALLEEVGNETFPRFTWSLAPSLRESFFDPQNPLRLGLFAQLGAEYRFNRRFAISASTDVSLWNNLVSNTPDNSLLPHVRSDFAKYYKYGANGISSLLLSYRWRLSPDLNAILKGGYLESMYGGFGGEILWHPDRSRFAVGVDLYQVWKRNYDRLFGFQSYHVLTGHISLYYQSPWHHVGFKVMYGRYLAKDHGFTVELFRRFSTGVEIGAFATLTNVSAAQFGEGSFDKGIIIKIPFDWILPIPTQSQFSMDLRPLTRDGGQRLTGDTTLYNRLQRESYGNIVSDWQRIYNP
jgi:hypothetical protein